MTLSQMAFARRAGQDPDALGGEYAVERPGELACAVSDQELEWGRALAEVRQEVAAACVAHAPSGCAVMPAR